MNTKNQETETKPASKALPSSPGSVVFRDATWEESCDECAHQEGRHFCLLHSIAAKNMDVVRCDDWKPRSVDLNYAVFRYIEQSLGEPLIEQVTHWLTLDRAISYADNNGGFVLSRFIPQND